MTDIVLDVIILSSIVFLYSS